MPANTTPVFAKVGETKWGKLLAANTAMDGTGTVVTVFTADPTNGSYLKKVTVRAKGTNVQTVLRLFLNNGSDNNTAANNTLIGDFTLPATAASNTTSLPGFEIPFNEVLPPGYRILATLGTTVAAGYDITGWGGSY